MEHNIWNPKMECADRETIRQMQLEGLKKTVKTCYERVPLYKKKFDAIGLRPEHIKTLKDIRHIPFTTSDDLKENYPCLLYTSASIHKVKRMFSRCKRGIFEQY